MTTLYSGETTGFDSVIEYDSSDALSLRKALTDLSVDPQNSEIKETASNTKQLKPQIIMP